MILIVLSAAPALSAEVEQASRGHQRCPGFFFNSTTLLALASIASRRS
jgi:hypothetical protein